MKTIKIEKNIEPILHVTKNIIKESDNFNDYYIRENNNLYKNQLPLLIRNSRIREVMSLKKLNRKDLINITEANDENEEQKNNPLYLSNIRNVHIRSKKLPPLCPFYSQRGELLPEVVVTSNLNNRNIAQTEGNYDINVSVSSNSLGKFSERKLACFSSPIYLKKIDHSNFYKILEINYDEFQKEILYEPKYDSLKYDNSEIFGHKEFYQEFIKGLVEEISILTGEEFDKSKFEENQDAKKEKIFEWGKSKKQILLTLNSIKVTIKEVTDAISDKQGNNDNKGNIILKENCFEYDLPFNLLPLFYYKGFEKFKLFLLSFLNYNEEAQKFEVNGNISKIVNILLNNCNDLKMKKENEENLNNDELNILQPVELKKTANILKLNSTKIEKSSASKNNLPGFFKNLSKSMNFGKGLLQSSLFAGTNVDIVVKKKLKKSNYDLYPKEKKSEDFLNFSNFQLFWNIGDKIFCINVEMPLITFSIPIYNIIVKQYIDYELLFYLYKINFDNWDFYVVKYLSSFRKFRILLSQLTAIRPKKNIHMFLDKYKNRYFESTDYKIINIITSKLLAEKEVVIVKQKKRTNRFLDLKKTKSKFIQEKSEESNKSNKDVTKEEKSENNEEKKRKEEEKKENIQSSPLPTEDTASQQGLTSNSLAQSTKTIVKLENSQIQTNSILEQKCFIAIVTITDTEKYISNQYTIHFNYSHFTKCKSMEKYMKKTSFLLKFININYEKNTVSFDFDALNAFNETNWMDEIEKYKLNYESEIQRENNSIINIEEDKNGQPVTVNKNKVEYPGAKNGTTIIIEIKPPILLLRRFNSDGTIYTKCTEIFEEEENKLSLNEGNNIYNLTKNMFEISIHHKQKENEERNNKEMANNILMYAFKKKFNK